MTRTVLIVLSMAAAAFAQPGPPPGRGPGGPGGFGGARLLGAEPGMRGRVVKNSPFTADIVTETNQTLQDGNRIHSSTTVHVARDTEGRTRREQTLRNLGGMAPNANLPQVVFIDDPVAGASYALNPSEHTATKSIVRRPGPDGQMRTRPDGQTQPMVRGGGDPNGPRPMGGRMGMRQNNPNVKTESLGRQTIEGVQADGRRTTVTIPAGQMGNEQPMQVVTETWFSPDLNMVVLEKRSDPRNGDHTMRVTNISRAEPSQTLFTVPSEYKVTEHARPGRGPAQ